MHKQVLYAILTILLVFIGAMLVFIRLVGDTASPVNQKIRIVTTITAYQQAAQQIVGDTGKVTLLPTDVQEWGAKDKEQLKKADIILVDHQDDQDTLIAQYRNWQLQSKIIAANQIVTDNDFDNLWVSPLTTKALSDKLTTTLSDIDPRNRDTYVSNDNQLNTKLSVLNTQLATLAKKNKNLNYISIGDDWDILFSQLNAQRVLKKVSHQSSSTLLDEVKDYIDDDKVDFVVMPNQQNNTTKQLVKLANSHKIPIITINYPKNQNEDILNWQQQNLNKIQNMINNLKK
ncbi:zinc ABC transporter substrate-binding protein [Leuconostoc fallax]|uniref:metal ABC transporter substrate-binding protein n=1 Tax=Leuconostoc fallax TaxID=1251 RepID=UPI0020915553|nr:zinc ABC transporter substrate-binding protein [Leuconostoc fallax]MCO6183414.1 zinc ABC transporter substrate-binding protein [Leuconostoc fallax]